MEFVDETGKPVDCHEGRISVSSYYYTSVDLWFSPDVATSMLMDKDLRPFY